jgi:hypothetical protein
MVKMRVKTMFKIVSAIFCILFLLTLSASANTLLSSYEPSETNLTVTSPDASMTITWPLLGGTGGVPPATDGSYVLRMSWTGETDHKVEIKHQWTGFTFDLAGNDHILVDVYIATSSALPEIVGIWDDVFGWVSGSPVPAVTNQWITVSMDVSNLEQTGLNHIYALLFEDLAGVDGTIYIDNLRLAPPTQIDFSGYSWTVKHGDNQMGPGPNYFSDSQDNVSVDANGHLHMKILQKDGKWYCSEVIANASPGYGTYVFTVKGRVDLLDRNIVLGMFTWDSFAPQYNYREIDFELSKWGDPYNDNAQFVIQPWNNPGNLHRFDIDYSAGTDVTTHVLTWLPDQLYFQSYYGDFALVPPPENMIESWYYTGDDLPPAGGENARINFWLMSGLAPANGQDAEIIIKSFQYLTDISDLPADIDNDGDVDLVDFACLAKEWLRNDCTPANSWCSRTDLTGDGNVDFQDLAKLADYWLAN